MLSQALELIHNPSTENDVRRQASEYLENLKASNEAPQYGFNLSTDRSQPPLVRHFGLSLLSHVIRHEAHQLSEEQNTPKVVEPQIRKAESRFDQETAT